MGKGVSLKCTKCNYKKEYHLGVGMIIHAMLLKDYIDLNLPMHNKTKEKIKRLYYKKENLIIEPIIKLYKCKECNKIYNKYYFEIYNNPEYEYSNEGLEPIFKTEFKCWRCNLELKEINLEKLNKAVCPKCGNYSFNKDALFLWD